MVDGDNLSLERPLISGGDQSSSDWIFKNVIPFLRITLAASDEMIEEPTLPKSTPAARDGGSYNSLKTAYPSAQIKINITRSKQMNVIGQNYIAAQCDPTSR